MPTSDINKVFAVKKICSIEVSRVVYKRDFPEKSVTLTPMKIILEYVICGWELLHLGEPWPGNMQNPPMPLAKISKNIGSEIFVPKSLFALYLNQNLDHFQNVVQLTSTVILSPKRTGCKKFCSWVPLGFILYIDTFNLVIRSANIKCKCSVSRTITNCLLIWLKTSILFGLWNAKIIWLLQLLISLKN